MNKQIKTIKLLMPNENYEKSLSLFDSIILSYFVAQSKAINSNIVYYKLDTLSKAMNVGSVKTIRESLKRLETEGYIERYSKSIADNVKGTTYRITWVSLTDKCKVFAKRDNGEPLSFVMLHVSDWNVYNFKNVNEWVLHSLMSAMKLDNFNLSLLTKMFSDSRETWKRTKKRLRQAGLYGELSQQATYDFTSIFTDFKQMFDDMGFTWTEYVNLKSLKKDKDFDVQFGHFLYEQLKDDDDETKRTRLATLDKYGITSTVVMDCWRKAGYVK